MSTFLLSDEAWTAINPVFQAILDHPFNQELASGMLLSETFSFYIEQDFLYLEEFARCLSFIAARTSDYRQDFLKYALFCVAEEQKSVHDFYRQRFPYGRTDLVTCATLSYTSFLLKTCSIEPVEVSIASVLPCFWVYHKMGKALAERSSSSNPYWVWIESYSSDSMESYVTDMLTIFNTIGQQVTQELRKKMLKAFYQSAVLEWHFWNDAYHKRMFDCLPLNPPIP